MPLPLPDPPFYVDWKFWSFAASGLAIVLSQIPPIRSLIGRRRLKLELGARISINHMVGYPTCQLYVSARNVGRKPVRLSGLRIAIRRGAEQPFELAAVQYFPQQADAKPVLFVPTTLETGHEWGHVAVFVQQLNQHDDRVLGQLRSSLREDIGAKVDLRRAAGLPDDQLVEGDEANLRPLLETYEREFRWRAGEFHATVTAVSDCDRPVKQECRFTLYESDTAALRSYAADYKHGFGPAIDVPRHGGIIAHVSNE